MPITKQKLSLLLLAIAFFGIQSASPMLGFNGKKDESTLATEAQKTSLNALTNANKADSKANQISVKLDAAEDRLNKLEQKAQSATSGIQATVNSASNNAAQNAAQGVENLLRQLVNDAKNHRNNAEYFKNQALNISKNVDTTIRSTLNSLETKMKKAAITEAERVEEAKQKVQDRFEAQRRAVELKTHEEMEKQRFETEKKLIHERIPLVKAEAEAKGEIEKALLKLKLEKPDEYEKELKVKADTELAIATKKEEEETKRSANRWNKVNEIIDQYTEPKKLAVIGTAVVGIGAGIYAAKYGLPIIISHLVQPRVVSETSKKSWFGYKAPTQQIAMSDLTFAPELQRQLLDIADRVQTAQLYNENLPNVMFYGAPGTGKTAFAKALALCSGLDYALTSGSEFAKITDLNLQNKELRKLLDWGMASDKGLIIFIDEAESLFANRKLPTTSKSVQDFINTFLALIPEKSQKNLMFIFATNHPFKLDDAITNRVGISVEFTLPQAPERTKILTTYLEKFAHENPDALVTFDPVVQKNLAKYGEALEGLAPRAIKYVAEEMVVYARRQKNRQLSDELARHAIKSAITSIQQTEHWATERDTWIKAQTAAA
jgi:AAA+ superfamily predicted ATPase